MSNGNGLTTKIIGGLVLFFIIGWLTIFSNRSTIAIAKADLNKEAIAENRADIKVVKNDITYIKDGIAEIKQMLKDK